MEVENCQAPLDMNAFKPLMTDDDSGIGEMGENEEIPYDILSPLVKSLNKKAFEPVSVKSKFKLKLNKKV